MPFRFALILAVGSVLFAQDSTEPKLTNSQLAEASQAKVYFEQNNLPAALPLYEHLAQEVPSSAVYAERLATCLLNLSGNAPAGPERIAMRKRARAEAERCKALGGKSNWLDSMFDQLNADPNGDTLSTNEKMRAAEAAFTKGDLDGALVLYKELAAEDPKNYQAPLFAGDMYFRKHDAANAGIWFQKAIDVNPNVETAYRYWGDALYRDGDKDQALSKYIDAIVADPYNKRSWMGLTQWAQRTGATLKAPEIKLPPGPTPTPNGKKGDVTITIDAGSLNQKDSGSAAWLMYGVSRTLWVQSKFAKEYPTEKEYRHSLAEEADALHMVLVSVKEQKVKEKTLDPSLKNLLALQDDGMLEAYILISIPDQGIAHDYAAYRAQHRDLLHAYIAKYLVHQN